jgi:hypothetical protein
MMNMMNYLIGCSLGQSLEAQHNNAVERTKLKPGEFPKLSVVAHLSR